MKQLHRDDLYCWSDFDEQRNIDFNSVLWVRTGGNIVVDPMPMRWHDLEHLSALGGLAWIVITNSDHIRAARALASYTGARIAGPAAEKGALGLHCDRWLSDGDELVPGLRAFALDGSKTPGELALLLEDTTLITGDLVRAHRAGSLMMLPNPKLTNRDAAVRSVQRLAALTTVEAVLVGDGWPVIQDGHARLSELVARLVVE